MVARQRIGEYELLFGTGDGDIKQAAFLFQLLTAGDGHDRGEEVLFHAGDIDVGEFQPLGRVDGHHRHLVGIFVVVLVFRSEQQHLL